MRCVALQHPCRDAPPPFMRGPRDPPACAVRPGAGRERSAPRAWHAGCVILEIVAGQQAPRRAPAGAAPPPRVQERHRVSQECHPDRGAASPAPGCQAQGKVCCRASPSLGIGGGVGARRVVVGRCRRADPCSHAPAFVHQARGSDLPLAGCDRVEQAVPPRRVDTLELVQEQDHVRRIERRMRAGRCQGREGEILREERSATNLCLHEQPAIGRAPVLWDRATWAGDRRGGGGRRRRPRGARRGGRGRSRASRATGCGAW